MLVCCRKPIFNLTLLAGILLALSGCGQKGPLYLADDPVLDPEPLELSQQELDDLQEEQAQEPQTPRRTTDEALKAGTFGGSLFPGEPAR